MLTRENTDSALQRSKTTNRAAALPEPLPEADGRQQGVNKLTPQKGLAEMVETCRDCPEIVRNVRPSKGVTRTMTPCRMLTNAKVENIMRGSQIVTPLPLIGSKKE